MRRPLGLLLLLLVPCALRAASEVRTVLVFPFENQGSRADLNWISESFAEILSSRLAGPQTYVLARDERNAAYLQLGIPADTPLTLASEFKVAQTLGVDWAVVGTFDVAGDRLTASTQLLDLRGLKLSSPLTEEDELNELVSLQARLAWRLLATHDPSFTVGKEEDFIRPFPEVRVDAFENYIRGLLATDEESRVHFFREADRLNPASHEAAFALGRLYFDQKEYADSAKWLRKLKEGDPNYQESLFLLGVDEYFLGHLPAAEEAFEVLAKGIPLNEVSNNLGVLQARRGRYVEALASFERAYQADPTDPDFCFNRAACLWYLQRYGDVAKALEEVLRVNDDDAEAHCLLAAVFKNLGDTTREQHELRWLAEHEAGSTPNSPEDILPQPHLKKNYDGRAFGLLALTVRNALEERLAALPPEQHSEVHLARGRKFLADGRLPEAEHELTEAVSLVPEDGGARLTLAQVLEAEGKHHEAAGELQTSLKLQNTVAAHLLLARVYLSLAQPEKARDQGRAALALDPTNQEAEQLVKRISVNAASRKTP